MGNKINTGISLTPLQLEHVQVMAKADNDRSVSAFVGILIDRAWEIWKIHNAQRAQATPLPPEHATPAAPETDAQAEGA